MASGSLPIREMELGGAQILFSGLLSLASLPWLEFLVDHPRACLQVRWQERR